MEEAPQESLIHVTLIPADLINIEVPSTITRNPLNYFYSIEPRVCQCKRQNTFYSQSALLCATLPRCASSDSLFTDGILRQIML